MEFIEGNKYKIDRKNNKIIDCKKCGVCGMLYLGKKYSKYCSPECADKGLKSEITMDQLFKDGKV